MGWAGDGPHPKGLGARSPNVIFTLPRGGDRTRLGSFSRKWTGVAQQLKLDIEFKLRAGDRALVFKQVRPYYQGSQP